MRVCFHFLSSNVEDIGGGYSKKDSIFFGMVQAGLDKKTKKC